MMTRPLLAALVLAAAALPGTAYADNAEWALWTCDWAAATDPSGMVTADPTTHFGYIQIGPLGVAADLADDDDTVAPGVPVPVPSPHLGPGSTAKVTQHCWIQVNVLENSIANHYTHAQAHCDFTSVVVGPVDRTSVMPYQICLIAYQARSTDDVLLCTWWRIEHEGHVEDWLAHDEFGGGGAVPAGSPARCFLPVSA